MIKLECDYQKIAQTILDHFRSGKLPPWKGSCVLSNEPPRNFGTGHTYEDANAGIISRRKFQSPWFLTATQVEQLGGEIKPGEWGVTVLRYGKQLEEPIGNEKRKSHRLFKVFNACQIVGIDFPEPVPPFPEHRGKTIRSADAIFENMKNAPTLVEYPILQPVYSAKRDVISLPSREYFPTLQVYYSALFHELTHSTGHASRLNRGAVIDWNLFNENALVLQYEEMIAEFGAAFLAAEAGIVEDNFVHSASYIACLLKHHPERLIEKTVDTAVIAASNACRFILGSKHSFRSD